MSSLANLLDGLTTEGELYERLEDDAVRCFACGHRCLIRAGKRGICQVRFNQGGKLRVPWGYVAALQSDPIEKKPFFHVMPGANALTFGMLGCDYHCSYCFTGDTIVVTDRGPLKLRDAFELGQTYHREKEAEISFPEDLRATTSRGHYRHVKGVFRHAYEGDLIQIKAFYLPAIRCTPDHRIYVTEDARHEPHEIRAGELKENHYLVVPRTYHFSSPQVIHTLEHLQSIEIIHRVSWRMPRADRQLVLDATARGRSSREIGEMIGKSASYVRHVRRKLRKNPLQDLQISLPRQEGDLVRFPNEHRPGIPARVPLTPDIARLLGYYCAEGSVNSSKQRPNSLTLNFSFSKKETALAQRVADLLAAGFGVSGRLVHRATTLGVSVTKSSLALLIKALAGGRSKEKCVPSMLFDAPREVVAAFLEACVEGDGHRFENGKVSVTTVSPHLAYGIAWLALKCGYFPSVYDSEMSETSIIQGRVVRRAPHQFSVVWYEKDIAGRRIVESKNYYLVPIRGIERIPFRGEVYNMEVEEEHNYLAGFFLVSNCQNWLTSQALRDPASDVSAQFVRKISPKQLVGYARSAKASVIVSSYNEPLITSEWAAAVFKEAKANGLMCAYVSNGNNTPEVMEYLLPYLDAYKIDLKCMNDKNYRSLGGTLQNTLDGIKRARELGLWVEVVTLVIPGFNDSTEELWEAARFLAGLSADIPWHVTAFHKDYKMTGPDNTDARTLMRAAEIGREAGLRYVYAGNLPGNVEEYENTNCPHCNARLVRRRGYVIREYAITGDGRCPKCGERIAGVWPKDPSAVALDGFGHPLPLY